MWRPPAFIRQFYLAHFSKPAGDRVAYRLIRKHAPRSIYEFGVGTTLRAARMIEAAAGAASASEISYTGVDQFEARSKDAPAGVSLKQAHCKLVATGARVRLLPGDAFSVLSRTPAKPGSVDLILIAADHDPKALARAWYLIERLAHQRTTILWQEPKPEAAGAFRVVSHEELRILAGSGRKLRAA
jgi:predicted O-methyltransferase YrrM